MSVAIANLPVWARSFAFADFRLLWLNVLLQSAAQGMHWVAVGWLVFDVSDSEFLVGASAALSMAPFFFLGPVAGAVADRADRRRLILAITLAAAVAALSMAAILFAGVAGIGWILALAALAGCVSAFIMTTRQSLTYDIVGARLALNGMSLNSVSMQIGLIGGPLLFSVLITRFGAGGLFLIVGCCYAASAVFPLFMRGRSTSASAAARAPRRESVPRVLAGYVGIMRRNRVLATLMALAAVTELFGFAHMAILPVIAKDVLSLDAFGLGVMTAVRQTGGVAGLLALSVLGDFRRKGALTFGVMLAFGACLMSLIFQIGAAYYVAMLALATACAMSVDTIYMTLMQENVPDDQRGRAMGAWTLSIGVAPVGHLGIGALAGRVGAPAALFVSGAALAASTLCAAAALPKIRRLA